MMNLVSKKNILAWMNSSAGGFLLLGISFLVGLTKVYFGRFVDEADNLTVGWLISEGYTLYRDVFSHHFPFPYYWVAGVVSLFGNSFAAVRVSVLLLQLVLYAASMRITGFYLVLGLSSLVWNLINQFHRGQQAIYATFEGHFMVIVFVIIFALLVKKSAVGKFTLAFTGILIALALLTDPLMIYPAVIACAAVFVSGVQSREQFRYREAFRRVLGVGAAAILPVGIYAIYLLSTGIFEDFYRNTIWFNAEVYAKYVNAEPIRVEGMIKNITTGLNILNARWYRLTSPFISLEPYFTVELENEHLYFSWIFSGFLFRLSILACMVGLALNRKPSAAIFLYLFSAALLVRRNAGFYTIGFTLVSLFAAFYLLYELRRLRVFQNIVSPNLALTAADPGKHFIMFSRRAGRMAWIALLTVIGLMQFWSAFRGGFFIADHWYAVTSGRHIKAIYEFEDGLREVTCNLENVELSVFPNNPLVHFVTGIPPASKYTFMYPWVAEIGQRELISELRENRASIVWLNLRRKAGTPEGVTAYMADTLEFLRAEYVELGSGIWMSPHLAEHCPVDPRRNPFDGDRG